MLDPKTASVEELQAALKSKKATCTGINSPFTCGANEPMPDYTGPMMSIAVGDELHGGAQPNTMLLSVVEIDGDGDGFGLIKVPMMNNVKLSVQLTGIKAAEGGCITAGSADLSNIEASVLTNTQRAKLEEVYVKFNEAINVAEQNAEVIAQIYNSIADLLKAVREKAKAAIEKINANTKPTEAELKELEKLAQNAIEAKAKELELLKNQGTNPEYTASLATWLEEQKNGLACLITIEAAPTTPIPKKGPAYFDEEFIFGECSLEGLTKEEPEIPAPIASEEIVNNAFGIVKESPELYAILSKIKTIYDFYSNCDNSNWKPYPNGVLPYCIWQNVTVSSAYKYSGLDIPFVSGIVDDIYGTVQGLKNIDKDIKHIVESTFTATMDIVEAYSKDCSGKQLNLKKAEYLALADKMAKLSDEGGIWRWIQLKGLSNEMAEVKTYLIDCKEATKLKQKINNLVDFITDYPKMATDLGVIIAKSASHLAKLSNTDINENRYKHGKIVAEALTLVIPISKAGKITKIEEIAAGVEKNLPKFERELEKLVQVQNVGKYDWALVKKYFQFIQDVTGRAIGVKQIEELKVALRAKEYTKLSPTEYINHSKLFTKSAKDKLIKEWELKTNQKWPTYNEVYLDKNGDIYKNIGDPYDAHHIIEQNYGGEHEWWNMHPAKFPDEHQAGIHGIGSPARELFK